MKNKTAAMVAIVTVAMVALFASAIVGSLNDDAYAKKYSGDSNAQTSAANNDRPAEVFSLTCLEYSSKQAQTV
jgi:hypothetical protein